MNHYLQLEKLVRLSEHLEELFLTVSGFGAAPLPPELADEIAATAGEIMVELADHRGDALAMCVIEDARRLREVARTFCPEAARVTETGRAFVSSLQLIIREDRRAA